MAWRGVDATQGEGCEFEPPEAEPFDVEGAVPLEVCGSEREACVMFNPERKCSSEQSAPDHRVVRKLIGVFDFILNIYFQAQPTYLG